MKYKCPTNGNKASPAFVHFKANKPYLIQANLITLTFQCLFQYIKGVSFGMGPSNHSPSKTLHFKITNVDSCLVRIHGGTSTSMNFFVVKNEYKVALVVASTKGC